jgi:PPM family protein phosphatase
MTTTVDIHAAGLTNVGLVRRRNEDALYVGDHLVAVADGLGGHVAGDVASSVVIETVRGYDRPVPADLLVSTAVEAVDVANRAVRTRIDADSDLAGMGTTLVALLWAGSKAAVVNIGDSRIYCRRGGRTTQITDDHLYGHLLSGTTRVPQLAGRLTRFLNGRPEGVSADVALRDLRQGDRYLLCSDGLSSYVPPADIEAAMKTLDKPDGLAKRLVELALDRGGPDNVTVVVVDVR